MHSLKNFNWNVELFAPKHVALDDLTAGSTMPNLKPQTISLTADLRSLVCTYYSAVFCLLHKILLLQIIIEKIRVYIVQTKAHY